MNDFKLILFDIDGTLIRSAGAGKEAFNKSFQKIYGISNGFENIMMMGRTDPSIVREALTNHGIPWRDDQVNQFRNDYYKFLTAGIKEPRPGKHLCLGIMSLLNTLHSHTDKIIGLLTGNWRTSAFIKLRYFGIDHFFKYGAFADDSEDRNNLTPIILKKIHHELKIRVKNKNVFVIGDTPLDIQCAKPHHVQTVGVATGFHNVHDLRTAHADYVFENFQNTSDVLNIFNG